MEVAMYLCESKQGVVKMHEVPGKNQEIFPGSSWLVTKRATHFLNL